MTLAPRVIDVVRQPPCTIRDAGPPVDVVSVTAINEDNAVKYPRRMRAVNDGMDRIG